MIHNVFLFSSQSGRLRRNALHILPKHFPTRCITSDIDRARHLGPTSKESGAILRKWYVSSFAGKSQTIKQLKAASAFNRAIPFSKTNISRSNLQSLSNCEYVVRKLGEWGQGGGSVLSVGSTDGRISGVVTFRYQVPMCVHRT